MIENVYSKINPDAEMRKHQLIVDRLKNIKEMEKILQGKSLTYKKYMNDKTFIESVIRNLEIEKSLLDDLYNMN